MLILCQLSLSSTGVLSPTLGLLQDIHVVCHFMRQTAKKPIHVEMEEHPGLLLITSRWPKELPVGVEEAGKASNEGSPYLLCMECCRTNKTYLLRTSCVCIDTATRAFVDSILRLVDADRADRPVIVGPPIQTVALHPGLSFRVPYGLHEYVRHDSRSGQCGLSIYGGSIIRHCMATSRDSCYGPT